MPKLNINPDQKIENMTICVPAYMKKLLEETGHPSRVITQVIDENLERITDGDIDRALELRKQTLRNAILTFTQANKELIVNDLIIEGLPELIKELKLTRELTTKVHSQVNSFTRETRVNFISELEKAIEICTEDLEI